MPKQEPNWYPGIQRQAPFHRGVEPDNPRHLTRKQKERESKPVYIDQPALPMDVSHIEPKLCPECHGMGREKKGRVCRVCNGEGVIPADPHCQEAG